MQIISNVALISINETVLVQLISFLIFLFIINRVMFRPLRNTMQEREQHVQQIRLDISDSETELEAIIDEMRIEEAAVRKAGLQMSKEMDRQGSQEAGKIMDAARGEISAESEKTRQKIQAQVVDARRAMAAEVDPLALAIMEKILDRRMAP